MKLAKIVDPVFIKAINKLNMQELSLKTAFKLKGIIIKTDEERQKYNDVRQAAFDKYGEKDDNGGIKIDNNGQVVMSKESTAAFISEINDLLSMEIDIPTLSVSELGNVTMSSNELFILDFLVE